LHFGTGAENRDREGTEKTILSNEDGLSPTPSPSTSSRIWAEIDFSKFLGYRQ